MNRPAQILELAWDLRGRTQPVRGQDRVHLSGLLKNTADTNLLLARRSGHRAPPWEVCHVQEPSSRPPRPRPAPALRGPYPRLFSTVVSQPNFWINHNRLPQVAPFTELLLARGANPVARTSLRKQMHPGYGEDAMHVYRDVTPNSWGEQFRFKKLVSEPTMRLIAERIRLHEPPTARRLTQGCRRVKIDPR